MLQLTYVNAASSATGEDRPMGRRKKIVDGAPNVVDEAFDEVLLARGGRRQASRAVGLGADSDDIRRTLAYQEDAASSASQLFLGDESEHRRCPPIHALSSRAQGD
jgi:hypothetical protein